MSIGSLSPHIRYCMFMIWLHALVYCGPGREAQKLVLDRVSASIVLCTTLPLSWTALNALAFMNASGLVFTIFPNIIYGEDNV